MSLPAGLVDGVVAEEVEVDMVDINAVMVPLQHVQMERLHSLLPGKVSNSFCMTQNDIILVSTVKVKQKTFN